MNPKRVKILIAKPGLDGHDVGAKVVARALMDAGFEVLYTGLRKSPAEIAAVARDEDADIIGLSVLSGSHLPICRKFAALRREYGIEGKLWMVGGNIPEKDREALERLGVNGVFPFGTPLGSIVDFIREKTG
jgi:methylmalonyl-CoA mutase C-terminal domain/subunit